jgi:hypothetical protein
MAAVPEDFTRWAVASTVSRGDGTFGGTVLDTRRGRATVNTCQHDHPTRTAARRCARAWISPGC